MCCVVVFLGSVFLSGVDGRVAFVMFDFFFFSSRRRHTRCLSDWSSDVCSSDLFLDWRRGKIIEGFGKLAAALRKENTGSIEFIGGLQSAGHRFLKMVLLGEQGGARFAFRDVRFNLFALFLADFVAGVKHQKRCNILAIQIFFKNAHRSPPSSWRSLRVARKSEFFTVSSVVPRASPIARSFSP